MSKSLMIDQQMIKEKSEILEEYQIISIRKSRNILQLKEVNLIVSDEPTAKGLFQLNKTQALAVHMASMQRCFILLDQLSKKQEKKIKDKEEKWEELQQNRIQRMQKLVKICFQASRLQSRVIWVRQSFDESQSFQYILNQTQLENVIRSQIYSKIQVSKLQQNPEAWVNDDWDDQIGPTVKIEPANPKYSSLLSPSSKKEESRQFLSYNQEASAISQSESVVPEKQIISIHEIIYKDGKPYVKYESDTVSNNLDERKIKVKTQDTYSLNVNNFQQRKIENYEKKEQDSQPTDLGQSQNSIFGRNIVSLNKANSNPPQRVNRSMSKRESELPIIYHSLTSKVIPLEFQEGPIQMVTLKDQLESKINFSQKSNPIEPQQISERKSNLAFRERRDQVNSSFSKK